MSWFALYVGVGVPAVLVLVGYCLARYDRWERRERPVNGFARLRGRAGKGLDTDEIMALTRGEDFPDDRPTHDPRRTKL